MNMVVDKESEIKASIPVLGGEWLSIKKIMLNISEKMGENYKYVLYGF